jgi:hypothetical protein
METRTSALKETHDRCFKNPDFNDTPCNAVLSVGLNFYPLDSKIGRVFLFCWKRYIREDGSSDFEYSKLRFIAVREVYIDE